jgi:uncharacterized protein (TIGR02611 family)
VGTPGTDQQAAGASARLRGWRDGVRRLPGGALMWRIGITAVGVLVIAGGVVLLPLPGPGWVVIFLGLGLLATEYAWAARLLRRSRLLLTQWTDWTRRQPVAVRAVFGVAAVLFLAALAYAAWRIYLAD